MDRSEFLLKNIRWLLHLPLIKRNPESLRNRCDNGQASLIGKTSWM